MLQQICILSIPPNDLDNELFTFGEYKNGSSSNSMRTVCFVFCAKSIINIRLWTWKRLRNGNDTSKLIFQAIICLDERAMSVKHYYLQSSFFLPFIRDCYGLTITSDKNKTHDPSENDQFSYAYNFQAKV